MDGPEDCRPDGASPVPMTAERVEALYVRLRPSIMRILIGTLDLDTDSAEDVLQEAFQALLNEQRPFASQEDVEAWLLQVVRNKAKDHHRRTSTTSAGLQARPYNPGGKTLSDMASPGPLSLLERRNALELTEEMLLSLPERDRAIVRMRDVDDKPFREIALMLGLTEVNVRKIYWRACRDTEERLFRYSSTLVERAGPRVQRRPRDRKELAEAFLLLPRRYGRALEHRYLSGLTAREIAALEGILEDEASALLARADELLRRLTILQVPEEVLRVAKA